MLAERLFQLGVDLRYDRRSQCFRSELGKAVNDKMLDHIIDDSHDQQGPPLPTMRSDNGKRIWHAFMLDVSYDPLINWFEEAEQVTTDDEKCDPGLLPQHLWGDRWVPSDISGHSWRAFFVAVVARAYEPEPVRFDIVPIVLGPQGCGKSTMITNLLPAEFTNGGFPLSGVSDFDAARKVVEYTEGKAILESSEMVGMKGSNREAVKSFLTRDTDRATRKYAIQAEDVPRRWCIAGTTNNTKPIPYDPSGGRRWAVTEITETHPDDGVRIHGYLDHLRHIYWAWAVSYYKELVKQGGEPVTAINLPESLTELHKSHVDFYMWKPS